METDMIENPFDNYTAPHPGTFGNALSVTRSDEVDLPVVPSFIWLGTPGDLRITALNGETVTFKNANIPFLPVRATRIHATETTASDIVIVW